MKNIFFESCLFPFRKCSFYLPTYLPNDYDSLIFGEKENIFRCFGDRERKRRTKRLDSKRRRYTDSLKVGPVGHRQEVESLLHEAGGYGPERFGKKNGETFLGGDKSCVGHRWSSKDLCQPFVRWEQRTLFVHSRYTSFTLRRWLGHRIPHNNFNGPFLDGSTGSNIITNFRVE